MPRKKGIVYLGSAGVIQQFSEAKLPVRFRGLCTIRGLLGGRMQNEKTDDAPEGAEEVTRER